MTLSRARPTPSGGPRGRARLQRRGALRRGSAGRRAVLRVRVGRRGRRRQEQRAARRAAHARGQLERVRSGGLPARGHGPRVPALLRRGSPKRNEGRGAAQGVHRRRERWGCSQASGYRDGACTNARAPTGGAWVPAPPARPASRVLGHLTGEQKAGQPGFQTPGEVSAGGARRGAPARTGTPAARSAPGRRAAPRAAAGRGATCRRPRARPGRRRRPAPTASPRPPRPGQAPRRARRQGCTPRRPAQPPR